MEPQGDRVVVVTASDRTPGPATPGMVREEAFSASGIWAGFVTTYPHMVSGWHHHGDHDTVVYVVTGRLRLESGPGGADVIEAGPGDFVFIPRQLVHREANPSDVRSELIGMRLGHGEALVNVEGPAQG